MARAHVVTARICEAWSCGQPLPTASRADRIYCSPRCQRRMLKARKRARERVAAGTPPTRTDRMLAARDTTFAQLLDSAPALVSPTTATRSQRMAATSSAANIERDTPAAAATRARAATVLTPADLAHATATRAHGDYLLPPSIGGEGFQRFATSPYPALFDADEVTGREIAAALNVSTATVSAWIDLYLTLRTQNLTARQWQDDPAATAARTHATSSFRAFSETFFPDELIPGFHTQWDTELTEALDTGERTMLLAPQRFGKTSWVIRQCLYHIARDPDVRIIVVGKTADLAKKVVGVIRQYLENDPQFAATLLPPDTSFRPPVKRGVPWTNDEFTVATRTKILKSPTMVALGVGGSILGRDADLIIIDDPLDRRMCLSPTEREKIIEWFFTDFNSRIEESTGVIYVGSRQHIEDLPGHIISNNSQRTADGLGADWKVLVYRAHDPACDVPLEDHPPFDAEQDTPTPREELSCLLWPQVRSGYWLAEQQRQNPEHFERNFQNNPNSDAFRPVRIEDIEHSYRLADWLVTSPRSPHAPRGPSTTQLLPALAGTTPYGFSRIASVDPAVSKNNAGVLWSYGASPVTLPRDPDDTDPTAPTTPVHVRWVTDTATPAPGSPGNVSLIKDWYERYQVTDWVWETNYYADQIANDRDLNDLRSRLGLRFHTHHTSASNKHDPRAGVLAMLASLRARPTGLLLPGGSDESRRRMRSLTHQMLTYDPEATHIRNRASVQDDLVMAAWFGWYWMERNTRTRTNSIKFDYGTGFDNFAPSYWSTPPWSDVA